MSKFDDVDLLTDIEVCKNPLEYYEYLRAKGPVVPLPYSNTMAITGYDEGLAVFRDDVNFSSINVTTGPQLPLAFDFTRDDISEQIETYRQANPALSQIVSQDSPGHARSKVLLSGVITPVRLKENEVFMGGLADQLIDEFIDKGTFDVINDYGRNFAQLVIADLLGVPEEDHWQFRTVGGSNLPGTIGDEVDMANDPLGRIAAQFFGYVHDRRANPRGDVLTRLAQQRYADGTLPEVADVVGVSTILFGAGADTTVQLIGAMLRFVAEDQDLQQRLRENRALIPEFVEETLRLQGTVVGSFRMTKKEMNLGGVDVPAGTHLLLLVGAMNRDPERYADPAELDIERGNVRSHLAFGRGIHACPGAPLARSEGRIALERLFDRTKSIRISEKHHGPAGARHFDDFPNYIMRGVREVHVEFERAD